MKRSKFYPLLKGLLSGDLRHWGAAQYQQYQRFLGGAQKVGIEIEANQKKSEQEIGNVKTDGWGVSWYRSDEFEITYLFDVSDPKKLLTNVSQAMRILDHYKITKLGGLHLNYQVKGDKAKEKTHKLVRGCCSGRYQMKSLLVTDLYRVECKLGSPFLYDQELIGQMILGYVGIYCQHSTACKLAQCLKRVMVEMCPRHIINPTKQVAVMLEELDKR